MNKYLSFFRIRIANGLQYRTAAFAGVITQFAWGFMELVMFTAFYKGDICAAPMSFSSLSSYVWLQQAFLALFMFWFWDSDIFEMIQSGNIAYELVRPIDLYTIWYTRNAAMRLSKALLRCLPLILVALLLPAPYHLGVPHTWQSFCLFFLTLALAFGIVVAISILIYIMTMYTLSPVGVRMVVLMVSEFLTGAVIPLPFFPNALRRIVELTPFAYIQNLPFQIYNGNLSGMDCIKPMIIQLIWLAVLIITGKAWMRSALKKIVVQGG